MAEQWKSPQSGDSDRRTDEDDQVRGIAEEGDEAFEDDEDDRDDEDEAEEEDGTF